jgi:hypothetical protein
MHQSACIVCAQSGGDVKFSSHVQLPRAQCMCTLPLRHCFIHGDARGNNQSTIISIGGGGGGGWRDSLFVVFSLKCVCMRSLSARGICSASQWEKGACGRDCFTVYSSGEFGTVGNKLRRKTLSWKELSPTYILEKCFELRFRVLSGAFSVLLFALTPRLPTHKYLRDFYCW